MNKDTKLQELASKLVEREVIYCVSSLISDLVKIASNCPESGLDFDDLMTILVQDDWETPGSWFIQNDTDMADLESIADNNGYWSDVLAESGVPVPYRIYTSEEEQWGFDGAKVIYDDEDDANEAALNSRMQTFRDKVEALVTEEDSWREVCEGNRIDPEQNEAMEHWIVSNWLAEKLAEKGEMTGEVMGLIIWGRTCTGQSISMDYVIQLCASELWPDELTGVEVDDGKG